MNSKKSFTITNLPITFWLCIFLLGFVVFIVLLNALLTPPPHTAMYVCMAIFIFIPWTIVALWTKMFKIEVKGNKISVRKGLGLVNFSFELSEITKVEWKTVETKFGVNEKITIFTSKSKKVPLETLMVNSGKMIKFIEENIEEHKINRIRKVMK